MTKKRTTYPQYKVDIINQYKLILEKSSITYLLHYQGSTVEELTLFRKKLKDINSRFKVVKNRLAKLAIKDSHLAIISDNLTGDSALVVSYDDVIAPSKLIVSELKINKNLKLFGAVISDDQETWLTDADIIALSKLESKEQLLAKLLYCFNAPITNLARTLNEIPTKFVRVLNSVIEKQPGDQA